MTPPPDDPTTLLRKVVATVAAHTGVPAADILGRSRRGNVVVARWIALENMYERRPLLPPATIARLFGRTLSWARFAGRQKVADTRFINLKKAISHDINCH